jgi:hypothetical protein
LSHSSNTYMRCLASFYYLSKFSVSDKRIGTLRAVERTLLEVGSFMGIEVNG